MLSAGQRGVRLALAAGAAGVAALPFLSVPAALAAQNAPAAPGAPAAPAAPAAVADGVRDSQQWVLNMLDVPEAWMDASGEGVTVAVIDSGVSTDVSDLIGSVRTGPDLTGLHTSPSNPHWGEHGTWMASIIAGHGHDGDNGIIGVAPDAKILSIRVIPDKDDPGYSTYDSEPEQTIQASLAKGIIDAVTDGAKVISMSIGYSAPSGAVRAAVQYAYSHGVVLVASSGNSGQDDERRDDGFAPVSFPAEYPGVIGVGALNRDGSPASFSSNNLSVMVAAPGEAIPAQGNDGLYWTVDGTSPACALVAGVVALIESRYPVITPAEVEEALTSTASNGSSGGYNDRTGFGTVDAAAALLAAGQLLGAHHAASPVAASAHFGGGAAAVPAAPVQPRGAGQLVLDAFLALASLSLVLAAGTGLVLLRRARGAHAVPAAARSSPGSGSPGSGYPAGPGFRHGFGPGARPGYGHPPGTGRTVPGNDYGAADDRA
jgi:type VII secretion-associated serine protease mycosin